MFPIKDISTDILRVGTMLTVSQWLSGGSLVDKSWQKNTLYTLAGFSTYHLTTRNFVGSDYSATAKAVVDDWAKVGTMMIVSRLLGGGSLLDKKWFYSCIATLIGFTVYDIVIAKYVKGNELTYNPKLQTVIDTTAKVGTMLTVSKALSCESLMDPKWVMGSIGTLVGFAVYDLGLSHFMDRF